MRSAGDDGLDWSLHVVLAMRPWFDAHLDLACLVLNGRDMLAPLERCGGPYPPPAVTLGSLARGGVAHALVTVFTEADGNEAPISYKAGDPEAAHRAGVAQLAVYHDWIRSGTARSWQAEGGKGATDGSLRIAVLIEGADPIRSPDELAWWARQGVVAVGLAWWKPSRYAGGNGTQTGLTDLGRALASEIDQLGLVHDFSHLSDRSFDELMDLAAGPVMASHSNCRAVLGDPANQRHLTDAQVRAIINRGGVIGLNLFSKFLRPDCHEGQRATISQCVDHIEHICTIAGHTKCVGLGSDMDGGFSGASLPQGINEPLGLELLATELSRRGWSETEVGGFVCENWRRFFGLAVG